MEVQEERTISNVPKSNYQHEFSLAFPYVLVELDQIQDVYEGSNENIKKATAVFVYDSSYKASNGRGYILMKPMQDEEKLFFPVPLGNISQFTVALKKPNGTLINYSTDNYKVLKLEYEEYNRLYIKVVIDKYFDKNEFSIGDTILIRGTSIIQPPLSQVPDTSYRSFNDFITRKEGHEIVQLGQPNSEGFLRNFYIFAPGTLDQETGKIVIDTDAIDAFREAIGVFDGPPPAIDCNSCLPDCVSDLQDPQQQVPSSTSNNFVGGGILNASLQTTIAMKVTVSQSDASILSTMNF